MTLFCGTTKFGCRRALALLALILASLFPSSAVGGRGEFVAVVITGDLESYRLAHASFMKGIASEEGSVRIYVQTPNPDLISWANSIRKAVGIGADIIITFGAPAALAAQHEARNTPVLFADVYDPVAIHLVRDPLHPGGDLSGISSKTPLETLVKTFREIYPFGRMGVLFSISDPGSTLQAKKLEELGRASGFSVVQRAIEKPQHISDALDFFSGRVDSLFVTESSMVQGALQEIIDYSEQHSLPLLGQTPGLCDRGGLMSLEADPSEQGELLADYFLKILKGAKIGTLPVRSPRKVALVINLAVAKHLGYKVPFQALSVATRVIK